MASQEEKRDRPIIVELVDEGDDRERRYVSLVFDDVCTLMEHTRGELTQTCYGAQAHGQKMSFSREAGATALEVDVQALQEELVSFFDEGAFLSDLQDLFDRAELSYTYASWLGGDIVFRRVCR